MGFEKCLKLWKFPASVLPVPKLQILLRLKTCTYPSWWVPADGWAAEVQSREKRRNPAEVCRTSCSLKPMADVKHIGGDGGLQRHSSPLFSRCVIVRRPFPLSSLPHTAWVRNFTNKCFHCQCTTYSNRPLNTVFGFTACHHHLSTPAAGKA